MLNRVKKFLSPQFEEMKEQLKVKDLIVTSLGRQLMDLQRQYRESLQATEYWKKQSDMLLAKLHDAQQVLKQKGI